MPAPPASSGANPEARLVRVLGVRQLSASIFNYTVGSGIFALPAIAVAQLGTAAPLAYFACAIVMALVVLCLAEAGSRVSLTGGTYAYVETALGPFVGFIAGILLLLTGLTAGAAVASLLAHSITALVPVHPDWLPPAIILVVVGALAAINIRSVRRSARVIELVTVAKLVPLLLFVIIGLAFVDPGRLAWNELPSASAVLGTAGIVIFAFSGVESALTPSGEVKDPARTVPRATFIALGAATALYLAIQWVALGILGTDLAANRTTPLAEAAAIFAGPAGRIVLIVGASISMLGYLSSNVLAVPRSLFALSRDRFLPRGLSAVHETHHTPHVAIGVYALVIIVLALSGTFEQLAVYANLTAFVLYILCAIGVWILRKRNVRGEGEPFVIPGGPLVPIATCAVNLWLIHETAGPRDLIGLGVIVAFAAISYGLRARRRV